MATIQAKRLRAILKETGVVDYRGKTPRVRTERHAFRENGKRYYEFGLASAIVCKQYCDEVALNALRNHSDSEIEFESDSFIWVRS
jgi:hypothetical protein